MVRAKSALWSQVRHFSLLRNISIQRISYLSPGPKAGAFLQTRHRSRGRLDPPTRVSAAGQGLPPQRIPLSQGAMAEDDPKQKTRAFFW